VYIDNAGEFYNMLDTSKMVHIVTDGRARSNPGDEQHAGTQTGDRSVATITGGNGYLGFDGFKQWITNWIRKWKRNG
jgi:hypothetical protein